MKLTKNQLMKINRQGAEEFEMPLVSFMFLKKHQNIDAIRVAAEKRGISVKQVMLENGMRFDHPKIYDEEDGE